MAVKTSIVKSAAVQTLENWCALCKIDKAIMNEIKDIVRDWLLPTKGPKYLPYSTFNWKKVALKYGIISMSISNMLVELYEAFWKHCG